MMTSLVAEYVEKINTRRRELEDFNKKILGDTSDSLLFAYRGEPRDYGRTKLTPSLFREDSYVEKEEHLFELLADFGVIDNSKSRNIEKMIDAQHYVAVSRALDITFNSLVALYFACASEENMGKDGVVYTFCFPNYVSPHSDEIEQLYCSIINDKDNHIIDKNFKVITHTKNNERIIAQYGGFIFFPGSNRCRLKDIYYREERISKDDKAKIVDELDKLFGINKAKLFPEKDSISEMVKKKYISDTYSRKKETGFIGQIEEYFVRLDYELEAYKKRDNSEIEIKRIIRKEIDDMEAYVDQLVIQEDKRCSIRKTIETKFDELRVSKL